MLRHCETWATCLVQALLKELTGGLVLGGSASHGIDGRGGQSSLGGIHVYVAITNIVKLGHGLVRVDRGHICFIPGGVVI